MKTPSKFLIAVVSMILGCAALVTTAVLALHEINLKNADSRDQEQLIDLGDLVWEPLSPTEQLQMKFSAYNFESKSSIETSEPSTFAPIVALNIYTDEQTARFAKMRENGERQSLSLDEILFIMSDSARIYYQYEKIVLTNAYKYGVFEPFENCPDSMTITPCHDDISTLSVEQASKKRADAVKDIYKIFFFRCYMYDTWLMKATESYWSASGICHDWGSFRLDSLEHEDYKYKAQVTATSYIKYLSESQFESYGSYLDSLEVSWDRFYNGLEVYCEQPLLIFVNYGVRIYYPNGSHAEQYVGDLVESTPQIDEHMVKNYYKYYYDGYVIVNNVVTNSGNLVYLNGVGRSNYFFGLSNTLFSETKTKK